MNFQQNQLRGNKHATIANTWLESLELTCFGVGDGHLSQVTVVVALHLQVEHLRLGVARFCNQEFV